MGFNEYPYTDLHEMNLDWILKKVKEMIGEWDTTKNAWNDLKEFVETYFENLDVQQEINNKLDEMAAGGELADLMAPYVDQQLPSVVGDQIADVVALQIGAVVAAQLPDVVTDQLPAIAASAAAAEVGTWLESHVDPDTGYVIDDTLTTPMAAADAKATGDAIKYVKDEVGSFNYSQTATARIMEVNLPVSSGDVVYFKPTKWTGDTFGNIDLYGNNSGNYTRIARVYAIGEESYVTLSASYEALRVTVNTAEAPGSRVTLECMISVIDDLSDLSDYVFMGKYETRKYLKNGYEFTSQASLYSPFDDMNTVPQQTIVSYTGSAMEHVAHSPIKSWGTLMTYSHKTSGFQGAQQVLVEVHTGIVYRRSNNGSWGEWLSDQNPIFINSTGWHGNYKAYTTFKAGMEAAYASGNCKVFVDDGTYDLLSEYGSEWIESYATTTACGLLIGKNMTVEFSNKAKVTANYAGSNDVFKQYFSPLNVTGTFKLINANIEVTNVRYCVHEDIGTIASVPAEYKSEYVDCIMKHNGNNLAGWTSNFCLGCGASRNGRSKVTGGQYVANNSRHVPIFWHNNSASGDASYVTITGVALGEDDHLHFRSIDTGNTVYADVSNNLFGAQISYSDEDVRMFILTEWNDVIRTADNN